jgi:hypothetical protein
MPNIAQILGLNPELATDEDPEFDLDAFMAETDKAVADSVVRQRGTEPASEIGGMLSTSDAPTEDPAPGVEEETEVEPEDEPEAEVPTPPAAVLPAPSDPLASLPAERRAQLLALDEFLQKDPSALKRLTEPEAQPVAAQLPEDIDPQSFEATLWRQNQETQSQLREITSATRLQAETFAKQAAAQAAQQAGANFAARYVGKLEQADVLAIAKAAGASGIAGVLASTPEGKADLAGAYDKALEITLWQNEIYRSKVVGETPVEQPGDKPEAKERKRKLTALSSAASPVSGPADKRSPLQSRDDGRLTPQSRSQLIQEAANGIARARMSEGIL